MDKQFRSRRKTGKVQKSLKKRPARRRVAAATPTTVAKPAEAEPSREEIAASHQLHLEQTQKKKNKSRRRPAPGEDLLASYMDMLSNIPLFTPEEEAENARNLETLDLAVWRLILAHPRGAEHARNEASEAEEALQGRVADLNASFERAAARAGKKALPTNAKRDELIESLAFELRRADSDKEMLEGIMTRLRRDVWTRRVISPRPAFRVSHEQLTQIEQAFGTANRGRNNFVRANLRLVVSVARNFSKYKVAFIDLIQEGNVGLMKAVHRFDHRRGFRFSTYAHWWIRQSIERAIINKGSQVRLPVHVIDARRQVARARNKLRYDLGRPANNAEIGRHLDLPEDKVDEILQGVQQDPVSLDESMGGDDPRRFIDLLRKDDDTPIDEAVIRESTHHQVRELLTKLNPIEKDIIRRRFGLGSDLDQTLDEIGKIYNLSRERVRQIQAQGLQKMRRMCERQQISVG